MEEYCQSFSERKILSMKPGKKIISALLAAVLLTSPASAVFTSAYAAEDDEKKEKTFDGAHYLEDTVPDSYFYTDQADDVIKSLEKKLLSALGKKDLNDVTFKDLQRPTTLNLSGLKLTEVPYCINYMTNLRTLNLSNNLLRNNGIGNLSLIGCTKLTNIDLSRNYLDRVPSWFVNERVTTKNIKENFIDGENPRSIKITDSTYYFMNDDLINEDELKNRILKSVRLNDGSLLPEFLFDYDGDAYVDGEFANKDNQLDIVDWSQLNSYLTTVSNSSNKRVKVEKGGDVIIDITVRLFKDSTGDNTKATVRFYLMDGTSTSSVKQRLDKLIEDCDKLKKDEYTENSWNNFDIALQTAKAIAAYSGSDASMLANSMSLLNSAKNGLTPAASTVKKTIDELVKIGGSSSYKEENYTPGSWADFTQALNRLKELQNDKNATFTEAQSAIKAFQSAQSRLISASLSVPAKVSKSDFEAIFGENLTRTYGGTTRDGKKYTWTFNGTDVTLPAEFNPEVKNTDAAEESILLEAGSASKYRLFAPVQTTAFPGKATLSIEVDNYADGSYYLYKWNTGEKRSKMVGTATVKDGKAVAVLSEGGVYYISKNIRNFELTSRRFKVDHSGKRIIIPLIGSYSVSTLKNSMDFGNYVEVADHNGDSVSNVSILYSGMTVNAPGGDKYTFKTSGDINSDNNYSLTDVTALLKLIVDGGDTMLADINGDGNVNTTDVTLLLDYVVNH